METKNFDAKKLWEDGKKQEAIKQLEEDCFSDKNGDSQILIAEKLILCGEYAKADNFLHKARNCVENELIKKVPADSKEVLDKRCMINLLNGLVQLKGFKKYKEAENYFQQAKQTCQDDQTQHRIDSQLEDVTRILEQLNLNDKPASDMNSTASSISNNDTSASSVSAQNHNLTQVVQDPQTLETEEEPKQIKKKQASYKIDEKRLEEAKMVKEMLEDMDNLVTPGSTWYLLSMDWVKKWQRYTYYDYLEPDQMAEEEVSEKERNTPPGPLNNSSILATLDKTRTILEEMQSKKWMNSHLKPNLKEGVDYMLVSLEIFDFLLKKYNCLPGHEVKRMGISVGEENMGEGLLEVNFRPINFVLIPNNLTKFECVKTLYVSRKDKLIDVRKALQRAINMRLFQKKERSLIVNNMRIWKCNFSKEEEYEAIEKKYKNYTQVKVDGKCLNPRPEDEDVLIEDVELAEEDVIVIELPKTLKPETYIFIPQNDEERNQFEQDYTNKTPDIDYVPPTLQEIQTRDLEAIMKPSSRRGVTGLQNLGNTCFMNSGLQCLSNTIELTKYFCNNMHKQDINKDNPLGMKGQLALTYGELIKEMWMSGSARTAPHELKKVVGKRVTKFSGFGQQDSCELINYVIDLMHEDLNRVKKKPYVEMQDSNGRPDQEVAQEHWDAFIARNRSIIVDLMYGQYKSTVQCQECGFISITFDPFLTLSVPIAKPHKLNLIYVPHKMFNITKGGNDWEVNPCRVFQFQIDQDTVGAIEAQVQSQVSEIEKSDEKRNMLTASYLYRTGHLTSKFSKEKLFLDVEQVNEDTLVYELETPQEDQLQNYRLTELCFMKQVKYGKTISGQHFSKSLPRLEYLPLDMTMMQLKRKIHEQVKSIFKNPLTDDSDINRSIMLHIVDNLPYVMAGKYNRKKATCEFCNDQHGQHDTCDIKINKISGNSEEGANEITVKDIYDKLEHKRDLIIGVVFREGCGAMMKFLDPELDQSHMQEMQKKKKDLITLDTCLKAYSREELLTGQDQWYCKECKEQRDIHKKLELYKLPKILIIQLKRFQSKRGAGNSKQGGFMAMAMAQVLHQEKVSELVDFPVEGLDLRPFIIDDSTDTPIYYDLYAVSNHYGSLNGGHYTAYAFNSMYNKWFEFNDSHVSQATPQEVVTQGAYLLFYRRRD
eukprot:403335950